MSSLNGFEIAIIGMAGRFPGSKNINEFWKNLCDGKELITHFTNEELIEAGIPEEYINDPNYVKSRGIIEGVEDFDAELFRFYPKELELLDPQQRLFLECSWEAMEDSGYTPDNYKGITGVFGGVGMNTYALQYLNSDDPLKVSAEAYQLSIGNDKDFLTTRVSYKLNLTGPSIDVQTACSTSLVATHIACMNLINYQCDLAIAGGATISLPQVNGYHYQEGMILSPDGHCRPFDSKAKGTVAGNGVGVVVLKRLEDAINDKDDIYAVIKGSAYNNDGSIKVGYTAPGVDGQQNVIAFAFAMSEIPMESVGYIETHGTGTELGDPIEIAALTSAFNTETEKKKFCAIGSVKSNTGHLDSAAGIAGLIKTALSIYHGKIPPSINYSEANEKIRFEDTPFYVNTKLIDWEDVTFLRTAGVSSFGIGGTNAHVVLQQAPAKVSSVKIPHHKIIPFSSMTKNSLNGIIEKFGNYLSNNSDQDITELAYTLQVGRKNFNNRCFTLAEDSEELKDILLTDSRRGLLRNSGSIIENHELVFMFSGQGSQYINMGRDLYELNGGFANYADKCFSILKDKLNIDLKSIIYPNDLNDSTLSEKLKQTEITQPALFVVEYSLAMSLVEIGIYPNVMVGHSIGEYVAACISGVFDLESALALVSKRGALMQKLEKGRMLSVTLPEIELKEILPENLDLAVINSPSLCVVSGKDDDIVKFEKVLTEKEISSAFLHTSHAFHSRMMQPIISEFKNLVDTIQLNEPTVPYMSNFTGQLITREEATDSNYYVNHLRHTVRFSENVTNLLSNTNNIFLEIGPGTTLTNLVKLNRNASERTVLNFMRNSRQNINDTKVLYTGIGNIWLNGYDLDWDKFYSVEKPSRIHIPTYAFDKKKYWLRINSKNTRTKRQNRNKPQICEQSWERLKTLTNVEKYDNSSLLIFENEKLTISQNISHLADPHNIITIIDGSDFKVINENEIRYNSQDINNRKKLFDHLSNENKLINNIVYNLNWGSKIEIDKLGLFIQNYERIINIIKSISDTWPNRKINFTIISDNYFEVIGSESVNSNFQSIVGLTNVIQQEQSNIKTKLIDINEKEFITHSQMKLNLFNELFSNSSERIIALRNNYRWRPTYSELDLTQNEKSIIKENGTYLITGGLGRIGLVIAYYLIIKCDANVILVDQKGMASKEEWNNQLINSDSSTQLDLMIKELVDNDKYFEKIRIIKADIQDKELFRNKIQEIIEKGIIINGVVHAAAIVGEKSFQLINDYNHSNFIDQANVKINGFKNLIEIFKKMNLDFILVQSSIASFLGGIGFASYSTVNNLIDNIVYKINKENNSSTKFLSVNWDAWNFKNDENSPHSIKSISPEQGVKLFDTIFSTDLPNQTIVSLGDMNERFNSIGTKAEENVSEKIEGDDNLHDRPVVETEYVDVENELQNEIREEWKNLLGIKEIGINDNFFELGGNSLIGTQLVSTMRKKFNVDIPIISVFENATIKGVANLINEHSNGNDDTKKVNEIFDLINNMTDEEAANHLKSND